MLASKLHMLGRSRLIRQAVSDPRLRVLVLFLLLFVAVALAWHLVGMADHSDGMMGACVALLVVVGLAVLFGEGLVLMVPLPPVVVTRPMPACGVLGPTGRSPPEEGTVLLR
jgi:hypothetical protein